MTFEQIARMVEQIGLPSAYDHFVEGESPEPPFVVFLIPSTENFMADGMVYQRVAQVNIELYANKKSPDVERKIERVLDAYGIPWDKDEEWIAQEKLYEVFYEFEVFYDDEDDTKEAKSLDDNG